MIQSAVSKRGYATTVMIDGVQVTLFAATESGLINSFVVLTRGLISYDSSKTERVRVHKITPLS